MQFDLTNLALIVPFSFLFTLVVYYVYFPILFYSKRSLDILYASVTHSTHGRFVALEVGLENVREYFDDHRVFGVRSTIFPKYDHEDRWMVVLKGRVLPFFGTYLSVEVKRLEPEQEPRKRFLFKVSISEGDDVLFCDLAIAKTSNLVSRDCLRLDSLLKKDSPLNLRIRIDINVVDGVETVCAGFTETITKADVMSQMYSSKDLGDCVIKISDRDLLCHKVVLTSTSDKFAHEMADGVVDFRDVMDGDAASDLLQYIYLRKTPNLEKTWSKLMSAADHYDLPDLKERCQRYLVSKLSVRTAVPYYELSLRHNGDFARKEVVKFVAVHKKEVQETPEFKDLEEDMANRLLVEALSLSDHEVYETRRRFSPSFERKGFQVIVIASLSILCLLGLYQVCTNLSYFGQYVASHIPFWFEKLSLASRYYIFVLRNNP